MLPQKKNQSFISTPVSRVGSSTRLNQLTGATGSRPSSRPATPGAYVTSSLNPARNVPVTSHNIRLKLTTPEEVARFEKVSIVEKLREFEAVLSELSQSISSFKEKDLVAEVKRLIDIDGEVSQELRLLHQHHKLGAESHALTKVSAELDSHLKTVLKELLSCRAKLRRLPKLPACRDEAEGLHSVDVQTVLDYAMKLAKFSRAPATVLSLFIHPNNYVWPAEDALRRGMLATASIRPDELIQAEIGTQQDDRISLSVPSDADVEMEDVEGLTVNGDAPKTSAAPKNGAVPISKEPSNKSAATLDLDLFDPEDDDEDSD